MSSSNTSMKRKGGRYCVAGGPNGLSCRNNSYTESISMHQFPKDPNIRAKWLKFVKRHRKDFAEPINQYAALCSAHFDESCYTRKLSISLEGIENFKMNRILTRGSIPTRDAVVVAEPAELTQRAKRQIKRDVLVEIQQPAKKCKYAAESVNTDVELQDEQQEVQHTLVHDENIRVETIQSESTVAQSPKAKKSKVSKRCSLCAEKVKKLETANRSTRRLKRRIRELKLRVKELENRIDTETEDDGEDETAEERQPTADELSDHDSDNYHDLDFTYASMEEETEQEESTADEDDSTKTNIRVEPGTPPAQEPKFIVFYSMLLSLFSMFCFTCKTENPQVSMKTQGTMVTVNQLCASCKVGFQWKSQPLVHGKHPAGNVLLSMAVLLAGGSISKVQLIFRHMGLCTYNIRTFFRHQRYILFPAVLYHWENYRASIITKLRSMKDIVWCGDGRFDSMGHSAKYGVYSMFCSTLMKICHFEIVQANETSGGQQAELEGCKRCFAFLGEAGVKVPVFISDRHRSIAKWIRESCPQTVHLYDVWHVARSVTKKLLKVSKEKGCEIISSWMKAIRSHLYWCASSTKQGFETMIVAKWKSFMRHVANKHKDHPDPLYKKCKHGDIQPRKWIKIGTVAYDKLQSILMKTALINDIKKLSPDAQTSCLEGFHATLNHWHPKMLCFSWMGSFCRHILASLHFNENLQRETKEKEDGTKYTKVVYPKYKLGEEVVREVACSPTYGYVDDIRALAFSLTSHEMSEILYRYSTKAPKTLTDQFVDRLSKQEAIQKRKDKQCGRLNTALFPTVEEQEKLEQQSKAPPPVTSSTRRPPQCKECEKPMRGHKRNQCSGRQKQPRRPRKQ